MMTSLRDLRGGQSAQVFISPSVWPPVSPDLLATDIWCSSAASVHKKNRKCKRVAIAYLGVIGIRAPAHYWQCREMVALMSLLLLLC